MPILRPGQTVIARQLSTGTVRECVLHGRNGCRPTEWLAHYIDEKGREHLMMVVPDTFIGIKTECGVQQIFEECL